VSTTIDQTFAALAEPTRLAVVRLLSHGPQRAGDIAHTLAMSRPAMSRHLRVLRKAGIVQEDSQEEDARVRMYRLRQAPFTELRGWLDEVEAFWIDQLGAFKAHAERGHKSEP
jgi:DNA-binding transcriptional ArsR family regulator